MFATIKSKTQVCLFLTALTGQACAAGQRATSSEEIKSRHTSRADSSIGPVLFLLSSENEQVLMNGKVRETGTFLSEFYEPYIAIQNDGYSAVFATPEGAPPALDPEGMKLKYWNNEFERDQARSFAQSSQAFNHPSSFDEVLQKPDTWAAVIVPGGQGVMSDIVPDQRAHRLVLQLARKRKPIGLICHAPALLKHLPHDENPLMGRAVTSVSPFEEFFIETFVMKGKAKDRKIGRQLRLAGYDYDSALPKANHAITDCNLVTSQNPFSGKSFVKQFRDVLEKSRQGTLCSP